MEVIWVPGIRPEDGRPGGGQPPGHDGDPDGAGPPPASPRPTRQVQWPGSSDRGTGTGETAGREPGSSQPTGGSRLADQAQDMASDTRWGQRLSRPRRGPKDQPPGISTQRFGDLHDRLRLRVLRYLDGQPGDQHRIDLLADVLGEAEGRARGPSSDEWDTRISEGLALLPPTHADSYTEMVPGIDDPAALFAGSPVTANDLIRAHARRESVTQGDVRYVIVSGQGRNASHLVGQGSDLVIFDRGQHFEVVRVGQDAEGRLEIELRHPAGQAGGSQAGHPVGDRNTAAAGTARELARIHGDSGTGRARKAASQHFHSGAA